MADIGAFGVGGNGICDLGAESEVEEDGAVVVCIMTGSVEFNSKKTPNKQTDNKKITIYVPRTGNSDSVSQTLLLGGEESTYQPWW